MELSEQLEMARLKLQNALLQAQSLERDVVVREYGRLMGEANGHQQLIGKLEEEVRINESKNGNDGGVNTVDGHEPINPE